MKNCNYPIGNRTRDLPVCSALPQPTAPPRAAVPSQAVSKLSVPCSQDMYTLTRERRSYKYSPPPPYHGCTPSSAGFVLKPMIASCWRDVVLSSCCKEALSLRVSVNMRPQRVRLLWFGLWRSYTVNLIVAPCIFVESLLLLTNNCTYTTST